jgi:ribosome-associated protein
MSQQTNVVSNTSQSQLLDNRIEAVINAASDKKATNIVVLNLQEIASFADYFIICSGASTRQVQAIADEITEQLAKNSKRPLHIEGYQKAEWVLIDYGDFIVHVFAEMVRQFYDLERLWRDAKRVQIKEL